MMVVSKAVSSYQKMKAKSDKILYSTDTLCWSSSPSRQFDCLFSNFHRAILSSSLTIALNSKKNSNTHAYKELSLSIVENASKSLTQIISEFISMF